MAWFTSLTKHWSQVGGPIPQSTGREIIPCYHSGVGERNPVEALHRQATQLGSKKAFSRVKKKTYTPPQSKQKVPESRRSQKENELPKKSPPTFRCLIGILILVDHNPYITAKYNPPIYLPTKGFCSLLK